LERKIQKRKEKCKQKDLENILKVYESLDETKVIANKFQINMTKTKITSLNKGTWLNDEVINYYLGILQERDNFLCTKYSYRKKSYYFNSFFWTKLTENNEFNFDHVKRWTKSFCIFDFDKVFIPINVVNAHWALIVIYISEKEICYYDSLVGTEGSKKQKVKLIIILNYLEMEAAAKEKSFSTNEWKLIETNVEKVPQQTNSYDCGMFMIYCADYISDDLPLLYKQSEMTDNRLKVFAAILRGYLNY
jgi:sentrin-specific protease 1